MFDVFIIINVINENLSDFHVISSLPEEILRTLQYNWLMQLSNMRSNLRYWSI